MGDAVRRLVLVVVSRERVKERLSIRDSVNKEILIRKSVIERV